MDKILAEYNANKLHRQTGEPQFIMWDDAYETYFIASENDMIYHPEIETYEVVQVVG